MLSRLILVFAAYLVVTPWLLPWYDLALVAVALAQPEPLGADAPLTIFALLFSLTTATTHPWIRYAIPLGCAALVLVRRRLRVPGPSPERPAPQPAEAAST